MKLYSVHCGYYDRRAGDGVYEAHVNFFIAAEDFMAAKKKIKEDSRFKEHKMHVDGIQEIIAVEGYNIFLEKSATPQPEVIKSLVYDEIN